MTTTTPSAAPGHRGVGRTLRPTGKVLPEHARAHNRSLVLQHLFHQGPSSRADLARSTGLTRVTVSDLVSVLISEGLVAELGVRPEGKVGKPATLVGMRTEEYQVVAVDLADDASLRGAVMTLTGAVVARRTVSLDGRTGDEAVAVLEDLCRELLAAADRPVVGVGIGSPGVIDAAGVVVQAPNRGWYDLPLAALLAERLGVPVQVANDANTHALGEYTYGGATGAGLMVVTVGQGLGAGIVLDGALVRGRAHAAGEIGHVTVVDDRDVRAGDPEPRPCACGRAGCLETLLSLPALRRATAGRSPEESDAVLASVGRKLGVALAPVVSALNLAEVLLSGPPELLDGALRVEALATVRARTLPLLGQDLVLRMGSLDEDGALSGAAALVLSGQLGVT
ncbi:ROK family transcriptional regulator [Cellulomonas sp. IC4_254]|uniref:ROK family transcriptional regulator n=1 Tax=Cellulomonas sp. IC4_254 TaxID=2714040 RepID=UPI001422971B|nr:ROK family transcriptional regulator [Cellulomonas sp. IC4_254]NHT17819.1 ROK family transcriptional regulator [Cellulomonas sp. IC4_254]